MSQKPEDSPKESTAAPDTATGASAPPPPHTTGAPQERTILALKVAAIVIVTLAIWFIPAPPGVDPRGMHMAAIFVGTILGLILQPLPTPSIALTGLAIAMITGTMTAKKEALAGFGNSAIWIIVAAFFYRRRVPYHRFRQTHRSSFCVSSG